MRRSAKLWISLDFVGSFWFVGNLMFEGQKPEDVLSCKCVVLVFPAAPSQPNVREREMKKNRMCIQSRATVHWPDRMENFWHGLVLRIVHWRQQGTVAKFCTGKCEKKSIKCLKQTCYSIFQNFPVCDICIEFSHQKIE